MIQGRIEMYIIYDFKFWGMDGRDAKQRCHILDISPHLYREI